MGFSPNARLLHDRAFVHDGRIVHDALTGIDGEAYYAELLGRRYADVGNR